MTRRVLAAAGVALGAAVLCAADPRPAGTVAEVAYFGPDEAARVRFDVTITGRPAEAVWREATDKLFTFLDRNGDGVLERRELDALNRLPVPIATGDGERPGGGRFGDPNAKLSRDAFAAGLRASGVGPVRVVVRVARADGQALNDALFKHLDADGDGKLSAAELKAARERLARFDTDEDELISAAELLGQPRAARPDARVVRLSTSGAEPDEPPSDVVTLAGPPDRAAKQLLATRDRDKSGGLSRQELGASEKAFSALDKDGNGQLDPDELTAWCQQPPVLELALAFGDASTGPAAVLTRPDRTPVLAPVTRKAADAEVRFYPPPDAGPGLKASWKAVATQARDQFDRALKGRPAIERRELDTLPDADVVAALFDFADRDRNAKLDKAELTAALDLFDALTLSRVEVVVRDAGRGLFDLLDRNGDGRLSPRELLAAGDLVKPLDRDGDGKLRKDEFPRQVLVECSVGGIVRFADVPTAAADGPPAAPTPMRVPGWFTKMDRNGDGDVSAREFLGPLELFRRFDRDGDGLVSAAEAARGPAE